jgi:hypothetical protein
MKRILAIIGSGLILGALSVNAGSYSLSDLTSHLIAPGTSYSGTFSLVYPASEEIIGAQAGFFLQDGSAGGPFPGGSESVTINLDGTFFGSAVNFVSVFVGGSVNLSLLDDNTLVYTIISDSSSAVPTYLQGAILNWQTGPKTLPVPDGTSAIALLGLAMAGLSWAGKRMRN